MLMILILSDSYLIYYWLSFDLELGEVLVDSAMF